MRFPNTLRGLKSIKIISIKIHLIEIIFKYLIDRLGILGVRLIQEVPKEGPKEVLVKVFTNM